MKNHIVESYENYKEEERLNSNHARRIEFLTTVRILKEYIKSPCKILDCAAGTGIYAFYFADAGCDVTATDVTPRHVAFMDEKLKDKPYTMRTSVLDATDLSVFEDESFDVVLNMGPFYHLKDKDKREACLRECRRVLKKDGLLVTAYIPRFYVFPYIAMNDVKFLDLGLAEQLTNTGISNHSDENCFWTDTYYATYEEMQEIYKKFQFEMIDHFAQDGIAPLLANKVDAWNDEQFQIWCEYHMKICREPSILGLSNHVILIGKK